MGCAVLLTGCAAPVRAQDTTLFAMDTVMNLRIYGDDGSAAKELSELIAGLDAALGATDAHSALYALNETGRSDDPTVCQMLALALAFCEETGGAVDPTVYPLVRLWGFPTGEYRVPSAQEIAAALNEQKNIELDHRKLSYDPIKSYGTYPIRVKLFPQIVGTFYLNVTE